MNERLVIDADVTRREDGIVLTYRCADGGVVEHYVSIVEARNVLSQLERQIGAVPQSALIASQDTK